MAEYLVQATDRTLSQHAEAPRGLPRLEQNICHYASRPITSGTRALGVLISHARTQPSLRAAMLQLNADRLQMLEDELRAGVAAGNVARRRRRATDGADDLFLPARPDQLPERG